MAQQHLPLPQRYSMIALTTALVIALALCFEIVLPFIPALVWSLTLAVLFAPVEQVLRRRFGRPTISASLALAMAALMVVVPAVLVSLALINEVFDGATTLAARLSQDHWSAWVTRHPAFAPTIGWVTEHLDPQQVLRTLSTRLGDWSAGIIAGSVTSVINLLLTFYFLFYLLRDRNRGLAAVAQLTPLTAAEFRILADRLVQTIFASVYGTAAVAALQGLLGGLMFWWLGLPSPLFWGVVMGLLAIVPFLGAFVVWAPAAIGLALDGQWFAAAMLAMWGTVVVGLVDNVVYPVLVGKRLAQHSMLSFIAIIGGLILFGAHGIVLGPLIVTAAQTLAEIWRSRMDLDKAAVAEAG